MTQKYNSANEIDPEFIPSLEELLAECIPSFDYIKHAENNAPDNIFYNYFLFFSNRTNAPIGFAQVEIKQTKATKKSLFDRFRKKTDLREKGVKSSRWFIPGSYKEGVVFEPMYIKHATPKAQKLLNEFCEREDIYAQEITYSHALGQLDFNHDVEHEVTNKKTYIADSLVKSKKNYEEFMKNLSSEDQRLISTSWKMIHKELQYQIGEYNNFKEVFAYKNKGAEQYNIIKKIPKVKTYLEESHSPVFMTLETKDEIKALLIYVMGKNGNAFYDIVLTEDQIPETIPHQMSIIQFFESKSSHRLHFLGDMNSHHHLISLGYTKREQHKLSIENK